MSTENTNQTAENQVANVETNDQKLARLTGELEQLQDAVLSQKRGTPEFSKAMNLAWNKEKEIAAITAQIAKAAKDAEIAEARNARLAMVDNYKAAVLAANGKNATEEQKLAEKELGDAIRNELTARYQTSTPAAKTAGDNSAGRGATGSAIKARLIELMEGGKTPSEAVKQMHEQEGFSRGTTGAVRTQMRKDGELVKYGENVPA